MVLPLLAFGGVAAALGTYVGSFFGDADTVTPEESALLGVSPLRVAYYAVLGMGVYWVARKTGTIKALK